MKMTLLGIVQNILSSMDSDEVNSIADTVESIQVAEVVRETYYELIANLDEPSLRTVAQLEALGDVDKPNYLRVPATIREIDWIKYDYQTDGSTDYEELTYLSPEEFLSFCSSRRGQEGIVEIEDFSGVRFHIGSTKNPKYWTSFDNNLLMFDSYDSSLDTTLQSSKTLVWAQKSPVFSMTDSFVPEMDANQFPQLLSEAKATCFMNSKQTANPREEGRARRQRIRRQNNLYRAGQQMSRLPNYGRTPR
jgi:hypothetical protein